jgi:hypothetical protein
LAFVNHLIESTGLPWIFTPNPGVQLTDPAGPIGRRDRSARVSPLLGPPVRDVASRGDSLAADIEELNKGPDVHALGLKESVAKQGPRRARINPRCTEVLQSPAQYRNANEHAEFVSQPAQDIFEVGL